MSEQFNSPGERLLEHPEHLQGVYCSQDTRVPLSELWGINSQHQRGCLDSREKKRVKKVLDILALSFTYFMFPDILEF